MVVVAFVFPWNFNLGLGFRNLVFLLRRGLRLRSIWSGLAILGRPCWPLLHTHIILNGMYDSSI
jgi:hypothetical protein